MTMFAGLLALVLSIVLQGVNARLAGECAMQCNDLRLEVLTLEICRDAKKTLPKPKVGDFCSNAMEQGFSDACNAICMDEKPVARLAQACRSAAVEMPRPTVRRWCEHGYRTAFEKTIGDLSSHFKPDGPADKKSKKMQDERDTRAAQQTADNKAKADKVAAATAAAAAANAAKQTAAAAAAEKTTADKTEVKDKAPAAKASEKTPTTTEKSKTATTTKVEVETTEEKKAADPNAMVEEVVTASGRERVVSATITVTIDDNNETKLLVYEGQTAEEAVLEYCQKNAADDISACIRQLLPVVMEKLGE